MQSSPLLTRRALSRLVAAPLVLSATAPGQQTRPAGDAVASEQRGEFQIAARQLAGVKLPRNVEPASRFEA